MEDEKNEKIGLPDAEEIRRIKIAEWAGDISPTDLAANYYDAAMALAAQGEPRIEVADLADLRGETKNWVPFENSAIVRLCAHDLFSKGDKTMLEARILKGERGFRTIFGRNEYSIGKAEGAKGSRLTSDERRNCRVEFTYSGELARRVQDFCRPANLQAALAKKGIETKFFELEAAETEASAEGADVPPPKPKVLET